MRIKQISVTHLFGIFNHPVPLNLEDHVTIIHGPNGFGKTTFLKMIDSFFNSRYTELRSTPFEEFTIDFDDGAKIWIDKKGESNSKKSKRKNNSPNLRFHFSKHESEIESFSPNYSEEPIEIDFPLRIIEREIPQLNQIGPMTWQDIVTDEILSLEDIVERFGDFLPIKNLIESKREPEWLQELKNSIHVRFIQTQRLSAPTYSRHQLRYERGISMTPAVTEYSKKLASVIKAKLAEYATLSQSLDRTFPARLVSQNSLSDLTIDTLRNKLRELEQKRSRLTAAGLLDQEENMEFQSPQQIDESKVSVLSVYVKDVEQKLSVFDQIAAKIEFLKKIINDRFLYKQMTINKDKEFTFSTSEGNLLSPTSLSTGEQHELVLLYELLFEVKPKSLILIDEPEISLHIAWQEQFLKDLQEMTNLSNFDAIIATHSPQIISDRWDLTVELRKPST